MQTLSLPAIKTSTHTIDYEPGLIALCHINGEGASGVDGISVLGNNYHIIGNVINDMGNDGVSIAAGSGGVLVTGNRVIAAGRHGVYIASTDGANLVTGNIIQDATTDGVHVAAASSNDMIGPNRITGSGGVDVNDNGTGTILTPDPDATADEIVFTKSGALADSTAGVSRVYAKVDRTITGVFAAVAGSPVTNPAVFDTNLDDTTIFTTQANRPEVAAAANVGDVETPDVTTWAAGSYLTVDVDTASSATDLTLTVQYTEA